MRPFLLTLCTLLFSAHFWAGAQDTVRPDTSALYDHRLKRLHAPEMVDLRQRFAGQPMLIINTASFCGYTGQFKGLEALHQRYRTAGLMVAGFPSDDFNQEAGNEAKSAEVCFINYGVTFDMFTPVHVRGAQAHPLFRELARQSGQPPQWNFYKYVVDREGRVVAAFSSAVSPDSPALKQAIESVL